MFEGGICKYDIYILINVYCWLLVPSIIFALFVSHSPCLDYIRSSDPGFTQQAVIPPPHYGTRVHRYRQMMGKTLCSLVDSHRVVPIRADRRSQQ